MASDAPSFAAATVPAADGFAPTLPSVDAAADLFRDRPGAVSSVVLTVLLRACLVGAGLRAAGLKLDDGLVKYSIAGALGIEAFVLVSVGYQHAMWARAQARGV